MSQRIEKKRIHEKEVVRRMIGIYCRGKHHTRQTLCPQCEALNQYAQSRVDKCPFMETKTFCSQCKVHCYQPEMRQEIRTVMRYAGPRMLVYAPLETLHHHFLEKK